MNASDVAQLCCPLVKREWTTGGGDQAQKNRFNWIGPRDPNDLGSAADGPSLKERGVSVTPDMQRKLDWSIYNLRVDAAPTIYINLLSHVLAVKNPSPVDPAEHPHAMHMILTQCGRTPKHRSAYHHSGLNEQQTMHNLPHMQTPTSHGPAPKAQVGTCAFARSVSTHCMGWHAHKCHCACSKCATTTAATVKTGRATHHQAY